MRRQEIVFFIAFGVACLFFVATVFFAVFAWLEVYA